MVLTVLEVLSNRQPVGDNAANEELVRFVERIERLSEEKAAAQDDITDIFKEARTKGFDTKTMRAVIQLRKLSKEQRQERQSLLDTYLAAFGMNDKD